MGEQDGVYLAARDDDFKRQVAVKLIRQGKASRDAQRRLVVERQILAGLNHPWIAALHDGGTTREVTVHGVSFRFSAVIAGEGGKGKPGRFPVPCRAVRIKIIFSIVYTRPKGRRGARSARSCRKKCPHSARFRPRRTPRRAAGGSQDSGRDRSGGSEGEPPGADDDPPAPGYHVPRQLPGSTARPWLLEPDPRSPEYGRETPDARGRVRVHLGRRHPFVNSGGWQYRYRLVVAYALGRALRSDEQIDHIDGVVDNDRLSNLRLLTPELHGSYHAWLFEIAGCRGVDGRFVEYAPDDVEVERASRVGPVISARDIDRLTWQPISHQLDSERNPYA